MEKDSFIATTLVPVVPAISEVGFVVSDFVRIDGSLARKPNVSGALLVCQKK
ncbi:MAG: hypothetical protein OEZ40_08365 [Candidatus Bathyarchaeota archaeon]|nr:hypothetical protein [Candidatus Bathyarchaeota archaeon]